MGNRRGHALLFIAVVLLEMLTGARPIGAASDTTAPTLQALTISPSSVDVSSSSATFTMSARVTDAASGVTEVRPVWVGPNDNWVGIYLPLASGDSHDGWWTGTITIPRYLSPGDYPLYFQGGDAAGNWFHLEAGDLAARGLPSHLHVEDSNPDAAPPQLTALRLSSRSIDSRSGDATLTIEADVTDSPAGVRQVDAFAVGPANSTAGGPEFTLVSGSAAAGTWRGTITIPQYTRSGTWSVGVDVFDAAFNGRRLDSSVLTSQGIDPSFTVASAEDTTPPSLAGLSVGPTTVDVSTAAATVTVRAHLTDNAAIRQSSSGAYDLAVLLQDPSTYQTSTCSDVTLVSGSAADGFFECQLTIAASSATSTRDLMLWITDVAGNQRNVTTAELEASGFTAHVVVRNGDEPLPRPVKSSDPPAPPSQPARAPSGYVMLSTDGRTYGFGIPARGDAAVGRYPAVDLALSPSSNGYWVVSSIGEVYAFGDASYLGGSPSLAPGESVTSLSSTPSGDGYWLFTNRGRVIPYGNAPTFGDLSGIALNGPVRDSIPTPSGQGYYMVASDGGVFSFGDADFHGSMGAVRLNQPVQSLVPDPDGAGYWLVASDGGIFSFDAPFYGSMGGTQLNKPVTGMVGRDDGYLMVGADGGIFTFGQTTFLGSLGDHPPAAPVVSVATR